MLVVHAKTTPSLIMKPDAHSKPNILLVDHACHVSTKSVDFLHAILSKRFDFSVHYYSHAYRPELPQSRRSNYDFLAFFEFLPGRLNLFYPTTRSVFFPMYDNEWGSKWCWRRIALTGMPVISFCSRVSNFARQHGVRDILDVKFFPDPKRYMDMKGDPRILLLWERGEMNFNVVKALFSPGTMKEVVLLRHPEEKIKHTELTDTDIAQYNVKIVETGFMPREQFLNTIRSAGTVIAPRKKEGIGMVFLEAMAMKKCVITHRDATMDEYIRHGSNGLFFDADNPSRIDIADVLRIHANMPDPSPYYDTWLLDQEKIASFIQCTPLLSLSKRAYFLYYLYYLFFIIEALKLRVPR
jgi:glycosyltransferase involved in cell wall biosynthesis